MCYNFTLGVINLLTKTQEKVLSALLSIDNFSMGSLSTVTGIPANVLDETLHELFHLDYLESLVRNYKKEIITASPSALGKHYFEEKRAVQHLELKKWISGFFTGVATSLVATYIWQLLTR